VVVPGAQPHIADERVADEVAKSMHVCADEIGGGILTERTLQTAAAGLVTHSTYQRKRLTCAIVDG
jgi:hypothetical protein